MPNGLYIRIFLVFEREPIPPLIRSTPSPYAGAIISHHPVMDRIRFIVDQFLENLAFRLFGSQGSQEVFSTDWISRATTILSVFGYIITLMSLIDLVATIIPPQSQNPVWELGTINLLMGQIWFFFMGFALVIMSYIVRFYLDSEADIPTIDPKLGRR
jgi:hypothetical protein